MKFFNSPKDPFNAPWGYKDVILIILIFNALMIPLFVGMKSSYPTLYDYLQNILFVLVPILSVKFGMKKSLASLGFKKEKYSIAVLTGLTFGLLLHISLSILHSSFFRVLSSLYLAGFNNLMKAIIVVFWHDGLVNLLLRPLGEELISRVLIYGGLRKKFDIAPSLIISSIIFTLLHFSQFSLGTISIFVAGIVYALIYEKYPSILVVFVTHSSYNFYRNISTLLVYLYPG